MIGLRKTDPPTYLLERIVGWTADLLAAMNSGNEQARRQIERRYNRPPIKEALLAETHGKCAYCESRIGSAGFPRIDHIKPRREAPELTFAWDNLTIACEACNGAKGDYWDPRMPLLNPYE